MGKKKPPMNQELEEKKEQVRYLLSDDRINVAAFGLNLWPGITGKAGSNKLKSKLRKVQNRDLNPEETEKLAQDLLAYAREIITRLEPAGEQTLPDPDAIQEPAPKTEKPEKKRSSIFAKKKKPE